MGANGNAGQGRIPEIPEDGTTPLYDVLQVQQRLFENLGELHRLTDRLKDAKTPATVVFFDLVGSTDFRRNYGEERALPKAIRHNLIVSQCIEGQSGHVVKWLGDGVMGVFHGEVEGRNHPYRALCAALQGVEHLREYNGAMKKQADYPPDEEVHTRVGLSAGKVHFVTVGHDAPLGDLQTPDASIQHRRPFSFCDPLGGCVDLASRLQSFAEMDVTSLTRTRFLVLGVQPAFLASL